MDSRQEHAGMTNCWDYSDVADQRSKIKNLNIPNPKFQIPNQHGFPPGARGNDKALGFLRFGGSKIQNLKCKM
jgi:hypothetical protein